MKDFAQLWNKVAGRRYSNAATNERELRDLSHNRIRRSDIDNSDLQNFECEGLNTRLDEDFSDKRDAILNRLFERRKKGQVTRKPKDLFIVLLLGFIILCAGLFMLIANPYDILFKLKVTFSDGGEIFEMWRKPEVELYTRIYLFNVTNAKEFMDGTDTKIKLQEIGPYVYRENLEHTNVTFNENGTLSSIPIHPLTWVEELSGGREDDVVYMPHIALLSIAHVVSQQSFFTRIGLNTLIRTTNTQPLAKMTAKEFMFGYESALMTLGYKFLPGWITFDKLGLIDRMYDFSGDYETIFTGESDVSNGGLIDTYRGSTDLTQWEGKHCSNVQYSSDGTKFKGFVKKNETIYFFRKSLCRTAPLVPTEEGYISGLHVYKYTIPNNTFDNGRYNEENKCFCRKGKCLPPGLIDVTDCYYGFPIALSYPHFYQGDEVLSSKVEGLTPNKEDHETNFWIEPRAGLPVEVSAKFQINMALGDLSSIENSGRFSNMYLPLVWFDIRMYGLPDPIRNRFNLYINVLRIVADCSMYLLLVGGSLLILFACYRLSFKIMFKTLESNKHGNIIIGTESWNTNEKKRHNKAVYAPCEIPLSTDSDSDQNTMLGNTERRPSGFVKAHSERIKELGAKLSDKVYDSVGSVKDKLKDEMVHVKHIFEERKNSLIDDTIDTNECSGITNKSYEALNSSDNEEDYNLVVLDDGSEFDDLRLGTDSLLTSKEAETRIGRLNILDSEDKIENDVILRISDDL